MERDPKEREPHEEEERPFPPTEEDVIDPITGARAGGPIGLNDPDREPGRWSTAARWFLFAVLALFVLAIIYYWFTRPA